MSEAGSRNHDAVVTMLMSTTLQAGARQTGGDLRLGPGQRGGSRREGAPTATPTAAAAARTAAAQGDHRAGISCASPAFVCTQSYRELLGYVVHGMRPSVAATTHPSHCRPRNFPCLGKQAQRRGGLL